MRITLEEIHSMEKQERVHFINCLGGFKSVALIGTKNQNQQNNLAIIDSIVHIGSNPPLFGIIFRPGAVERHTLENILTTHYFTINHIHEKIHSQAHQTSARYPRETSEFVATGLTPQYKDDFFAPFVTESKIQIAMKFEQKIPLEINNTILIISSVQAVYFPENCLYPDGFLDIEKAKTITCSGLDSYHTTNKINRWSYAKPNKPLIALPNVHNQETRK